MRFRNMVSRLMIHLIGDVLVGGDSFEIVDLVMCIRVFNILVHVCIFSNRRGLANFDFASKLARLGLERSVWPNLRWSSNPCPRLLGR